MRAFAPASFGLNRPEFFAEIIEQRLAHSGEYVRHLPVGKAVQWVIVNYQYIPVDAQFGGDYKLSGTNPALYGYAEHYADKPELYRDGDSVRPSRGSQFEVRGLVYNVKRVDINHVGYMKVELVLDDKCSEVRPEFFDEAANQVCSQLPVCP